MTVTVSPKLAGYLGLGGLAVLAGLAFGYPEAAVLGVPFLGAVLMALVLVDPPVVGASVEPDRDRLLEGEAVNVAVTLQSSTFIPWLQLAWPLPANLAVEGGGEVRGMTLAGGTGGTGTGAAEGGATGAGAGGASGAPFRFETAMTARRWGVVAMPQLLLRAHDELGFFRFEGAVDPQRVLRVYPRPEALRRAISAAETQMFGGNELSRGHGDGTEFANVRPYAAGDRPRRINWRMSTRTGRLHINEAHPERNADVVIFLDLFTDVRNGSEGTLDYAVRAAAALADYYLGRRDRVGVVGFGGVLQWLMPAMGLRQIYRIVDSLIDSEIFVSHVRRGVETIPPRTLPPNSLVVALTPLIDGRVVDALVDLRGRGFDLIIVEVQPEPFAVPDSRESSHLAYRYWQLDREATRLRYRSLGVPLVQWRPGMSLAGPMTEARQFGRRDQWLHA